jgi:hypothetical protein
MGLIPYYPSFFNCFPHFRAGNDSRFPRNGAPLPVSAVIFQLLTVG